MALPKTEIQVVWFKRDLRVGDHAPLTLAAAAGPVIPIYIVEADYWALPDSSSRHWNFVRDCLFDLNDALQARGTPLILRVGGAINVLEALRQQFGTFTLWSHEETGNAWTYRRDLDVLAWARENGIVWHELPSHGVVRRLSNRDRWSKIRDSRLSETIVDPPQTLVPVIGVGFDPVPGTQDRLFGPDFLAKGQDGGTRQGQQVLASFLKERGRNYLKTISKPGVSARHCSRLSAHIAFGSLSVKQVEHATRAKLSALVELPEVDAQQFARNLGAFLSRIAWRCHFVQKLESQPDIETHCMHPAFEGMREPHFRADYFTAWKEGRTGYPIIDAAMRSLIENGWITFRMRAMLVSFASYHLWLDWRVTAPYLARLFTDYEPGIHYSQFQMQSGVTGINAIRMYSPVKQSTDHDPEGKFIRRYVPELADVSPQWIHQPWMMPEPPPAYPPPIVDHDTAIKHARREIGARWKSEGFRDQAQSVHQKLGSRAPKQQRQLAIPKKTKPKPDRQLSFDL